MEEEQLITWNIRWDLHVPSEGAKELKTKVFDQPKR